MMIVFLPGISEISQMILHQDGGIRAQIFILGIEAIWERQSETLGQLLQQRDTV